MEGLIISIIVAVLALSKVAVNVFQSISTTKTLQNRNADIIVETKSGKKYGFPEETVKWYQQKSLYLLCNRSFMINRR